MDSDELKISKDNTYFDNKKKKSYESSSKWVDNNGKDVYEVFGFNVNAELVNGRAAMIGFLMLILTEFIFHGEPALKSIFGIY